MNCINVFGLLMKHVILKLIFLQISFWLLVKSVAFFKFEFDGCIQVNLPHVSFLQIDILGDCRCSEADKF